jgi:hypothetical protein
MGMSLGLLLCQSSSAAYRNGRFEEMPCALKEIESTITDLSAEKEPVENILVIDREGHVNISSEGK